MTINTNLKSATAHYLKIEDSKGTELYTKSYSTFAEAENEFNNISFSSKSYSFLPRTALPVLCDNIKNFCKSFFIPNTSSLITGLESKVAKVALGIFTVLFDIGTLPIRLLTVVPYVIYDKCRKKQDHQIIDLIKNHPSASYALSQGKVTATIISENFEKITPISDDIYDVNGEISGKRKSFYIKRGLFFNTANTKTFSESMDATMDKDFLLENYRAFQTQG